jgi:hypothetical protein
MSIRDWLQVNEGVLSERVQKDFWILQSGTQRLQLLLAAKYCLTDSFYES